MAVGKVSDATFESEVLKSTEPVVVDFWAEWCGPCKQISPLIEEIAAELGDRLVVAKINIDENPQTPTRYRVRGIPTLLLFKDGDVAAMKVGSMPKTALSEWVKMKKRLESGK